MERTPANPPHAMPNTCWKCGYDLSKLDTGRCPECGVGFATGRDVARLREQLLGRREALCRRCGTARGDAAEVRCPTCGMRYAAADGNGEHVRSPRRSGVHGVESGPIDEPARAERPAPRGEPMRTAPFAFLLLAGLVAAVALVMLANNFAGVLSPVLVTLMKLAALLLAGWMLGWLFLRLLRRDVESLRGQLGSGPRGWSHRVVDRCPNCGYDTAGLSDGRCPECGLKLNQEQEDDEQSSG